MENNQAVKINGQEVYWYEIRIVAVKRNQASPNWPNSWLSGFSLGRENVQPEVILSLFH